MNYYLPLIALSLALLSACSDGLETNALTSNEQQTDELVADAGVDQIINEGNPVNLSAGGSLNAISYFWEQTGGSSVINLSADDQSVVSFTAPLVDANSVYTFRLTVSDSAGNSASDEVSVTVVNSAPAVAVAEINASEVNEGEQVQLSGNSSQAIDNGVIASYQWQQVGENSATTNLSTSSVFTFTTPSNFGTDTILTFRLTVIDDSGTSDSDEVELLVNNSPTALLTADNLDVNEGDTVEVSATSSSDSNNGSISNYLLRLIDIDGQESTLHDGNNAPVYPYKTKYVSTSSKITFLLTVTDNDGASSADDLIVGILNSSDNNQAPQAEISYSNFNGELEETSSLELSAANSIDPDGEIISYLWQEIDHEGNVIDLGTASSITYEPPDVEFDYQYQIVLTVTDDDENTGEDTLDILILNLDNEAPVPVASSNLNNGITNEGDTVVLSAEQSYDDDQIATYLWQQIDSNGDIVSGSGALSITDYDKVNASFTAPTDLESDTSYTFRLTLTDNEAISASAEISILVNNSPTAVITVDDLRVNESSGTLDLIGSDSYDTDGGSIWYSWEQTGGTTVSIADPLSATASFEVPAVDADTDLTFELTVDDAYAAADTSEVVISINNSPTAAISSDLILANEFASVELDGSDSVDSGSEGIVSHAWIQTSGSPTASLVNDTSDIASFSAPEIFADTNLTFQLTVSDADGTSSSATTVVQINNGPTVSASLSTERLTEGDILELNASASDTDDGSIASYSWERLADDATTETVATTANFALTTDDIDLDTTYTYIFTATDNSGASTSAADLTVTVNNAPTATVPANFEVNESTADVELDGSGSTDTGSTGIASYVWQQIGTGSTVSINNSSSDIASFTAPIVNQDETLTFQLTVTDDDGASTSASTEVSINNYPTATVSVSTTDLNEGDSVTLAGGGSDADGSVTHTWHSVDDEGNIKTPALTTKADYVFTAAAVDADTSYTFRYTVTDSDGASTSADDIVLNVNNSPTAATAADSFVNEYTEGKLDGSGSSDEGGSIVSYQWLQVDADGNEVTDANSLYVGAITPDESDASLASFTAPEVSKDETLYFQLTVTDDDGAKHSITTSTLINAAPEVSISTSTSTTQITEGEAITLQGTGSDTSSATEDLTYQWQQINADSSTTDLNSEPDYTFTSSSDLSADASYTFRFTVSDESGASDSEDITIDVDNTGPSASIANITTTEVEEGQAGIILDASASSGGITSYLWQQVDAAGNLVEQDAVTISNPDSEQTTFTAPSDLTTATSIYFRLTVADDDDATQDNSAIVIFSVANSVSPAVTALADFNADEGTTDVALNIATSSGGISSYSWTQIELGSNPAVTIAPADSADPTNPSASFTAPSDLTETITLTFRVDASDDDAKLASDTVAVTINNSALPTADVSATTTTVAEGQTGVSLNASASSGGISSYQWQQVYSSGDSTSTNAVTITDASSALTSFDAPDNLTETITLSFELTVQDDDSTTAASSATTEITVTNNPPTADLSNTASEADEGASVSLDASTSSGGISSYLWQQVDDQDNVISDGVNIDNADAEQATFTAPYLTTSVATSEVLTFKLTIDDDDSTTDPVSATTAITINDVTDGNAAPTADAGTDQIGIAEGAAVELSGAASSDADGIIVSYSWVQNDGSGIDIDITASDQPSASFTAPYLLAGTTFTFTFDLTVTDDDGATSSAASVTVEVLDNNTNNSAPEIVISSGLNPTVYEASTVSLEASVSDSDGYVASYSWLQTDASGTTLIADTADDYITLTGADTASASFTAPAIVDDSITSNTYYFILSVTDDDGSQNLSELITVVVNNTYTSAAITASASAPNFDQLSLSWPTTTGLTYDLHRSSASDCDLSATSNCADYQLYAALDLSSGAQIDSGLDFFSSYYYWLEAQFDGTAVSLSSTPTEANTTGPQLNDTGVTQGGDYPSGFDSLGGGTACNGGYLIDDNGDVIADPDNHSGNSTFVAFIDEDCELGRDHTVNDDSDGHAGFSYTKLDSAGNTLSADATEWACVLDNVTGLIWEVKTTDGGTHDANTLYTWYSEDGVSIDGKTFQGTDDGINPTTHELIDATNTEQLCGQSNWRLPSATEMLSLRNNSVVGDNFPTDSAYLPNFQNAHYWTSSVNHFANGDGDDNPDTYPLWNIGPTDLVSWSGNGPSSIARRAIVVSSSSTGADDYLNDWSDERYDIHSDGTVSDKRTGLMWMRCGYDTWFSFYESANDTCVESNPGQYGGASYLGAFRDEIKVANDVTHYNNIGGYSDWRLPNLTELFSLFDHSAGDADTGQALINPNAFPNAEPQFYRSSTPSANGDANYYINFSPTAVFAIGLGGIDNGYRIRLVRDDINTPRILTLDINGDNVINSEDELASIPVSGNTIDIEDGQQITLVIDTTTFYVAVSSDTVSGTIDLSTITDGIDIAVTADAFDIAGRAADQFTSTLLKDTVIPSITGVLVADDNFINSAEASTATISGTTEGVEDGQTMSIAINDNADPVVEITATASVTDNAFSITNLDLSGLADGTGLSLTADVADAAGNEATQFTNSSIVKDVAAPTITIDSVATDGIINASEQSAVVINGTASENDQIVLLAISDGTNTFEADTTISNNSYSATVDLSSLAESTGIILGVGVADAAGNEASASKTDIVKDTLKPSIVSISVTDDNVVNSSEILSPVAVSGSTTGVEDNQQITLTINGADITATVSSNSFSTSADLSGLADGTYAVSANVSDAAGNPADEATSSFEIDTTAPTQTVDLASISFSTDSGSNASDFITNQATQTIGATLDAALGADDVLYASVNGGSTWQPVDSSNISGTSIAWPTTLLEGTSSIQFQVADSADNRGSTTQQSYTLDTTAPTQSVSTIAFSVDSGTAGDLVTNTAAQTITATLSAELETGDRLFGAVSLNGENDPNWVNITGNVNVQAISWATTLSAGTNEVQFSIEDAAGNSATTTQAYTLDQTNPSASASDVSANEASTATLNASASSDDLSGIASYSWAQVDIDGGAFSGSAALAITDADSDQALVTTPSIAEDSIANQVFYFAVTVTDKADNSATSSPLTLTVSNNYTTPTITTNIGTAPDFDQISLSWSADTSMTYSLYRSTDLDCVNALESIANIASCDDNTIYTEGGAEPAISISSDTASITDTGLEFFTNYYYWLEAKLSSGEVVSLSPEQTATTSGPVLNDTGITGGGDYPSGFDNHNGLSNTCDGGYLVDDQGAVIADPSTYTGTTTFVGFVDEDCELGRDANATLNDDSDGNAAFVFTKLDIDGTVLAADASAWSCVLDHATGLIWEVKTTDGTWRDRNMAFTWYNPNHGQDYDKDGNTITFDGTESSQDTQDFIAYVNSDPSVNSGSGLCGRSNWRLPTVHEIEGLADYDAVVAVVADDGSTSYSTPTIDTNYFPYTIASQYQWYWTSHLNVDPDVNTGGGSSTSNYFAWTYGSAESRTRSGTGSTVGTTDRYNFVRLVSSSTAVASHFSDYSNDRYTDNGDGTISDHQTGLMWSKCSYGQTYDANDANSDGIICEGSPAFGTWQQAFAWAADSTDHGHSDWRLPNIKELGSIVDFGSAKPAINQSIFPNTASGPYWSSTPSRANVLQTIFIGFQAGDYGPSDRISNLYLRLVRNLD